MTVKHSNRHKSIGETDIQHFDIIQGRSIEKFQVIAVQPIRIHTFNRTLQTPISSDGSVSGTDIRWMNRLRILRAHSKEGWSVL